MIFLIAKYGIIRFILLSVHPNTILIDAQADVELNYMMIMISFRKKIIINEVPQDSYFFNERSSTHFYYLLFLEWETLLNNSMKYTNVLLNDNSRIMKCKMVIHEIFSPKISSLKWDETKTSGIHQNNNLSFLLCSLTIGDLLSHFGVSYYVIPYYIIYINILPHKLKLSNVTNTPFSTLFPTQSLLLDEDEFHVW